MVGVLGISSPYNSSVGVTRELAYNSNITSVRGYLVSGEEQELDDLDAGNMLTAAELVTSFAANHDDPPRVAMNSTQTRHTIPVEKADKLLVGTGADKTIAQVIDDTFVFKAKQDGKVVHYDEKSKLMVLQYKDNTKDVIDLREKLDKNGGGGFYITNSKKTKFKVGSTFKKDDIIAFNEDYFSDKDGSVDYTVGTLAKVGIYGGYYTYEDSVLVSETLSEKMASYVTMEKHLVLGPNTNIISCLDPGDPVQVGQGVITIEDSYDEKEANLLLSKIGDEYKQDVLEQGKNTVYSKYTGEIADIEVYYTCEFEQLSPSLQKFIKRINKVHEERMKVLKQHFPDKVNELNVDIKPTGKVLPSSNGKIKGIEVGEGVLVRIFTRYRDAMGVGDKLTFYSALKGVIQQVLPEDLSPYSENYPDEPIEAILAPGAIQARMCGSAFINLWSNKALVELKREIREMYGMKRYDKK